MRNALAASRRRSQQWFDIQRQNKVPDSKSVAQTDGGLCAQGFQRGEAEDITAGRQLVDIDGDIGNGRTAGRTSTAGAGGGAQPQPYDVAATSTGTAELQTGDSHCDADNGGDPAAPISGGATPHKLDRDLSTSYGHPNKPQFFFPLQQKPGKKSTRTPMSGRSLDEARLSVLRSGSTTGCTMTLKYENTGAGND